VSSPLSILFLYTRSALNVSGGRSTVPCQKSGEVPTNPVSDFGSRRQIVTKGQVVTMLMTVDDACDFIAEWCQEPGSYPGQPLANDFAVPDCVARLNARLGDLWRSAERVSGPILRRMTPFLGLLDGQDRILNPNEYARGENGIVPAVWENQGVWGYGFDPKDVDRLLVCGDWCDGLRGDFETEWRRVEAKLEDALVCTLLINLCMESNANWDDNAAKPEAAHIALWAHPAWSDFEGFWINEERTLIYFSGWQVTQR
jgi:hypothetical protein